jgi:quercetin dioxygenase-like cupin family protein
MKILRFDRGLGKPIDRYRSTGFLLSPVVHLFGEAVVNCAYLEVNGVIGYHQAAASQLFLVMQGEGWVRGESSERIHIQSGQAAYWESGEWHESGTETGMTAIIIEAANIDLSKLTPLI